MATSSLVKRSLTASLATLANSASSEEQLHRAPAVSQVTTVKPNLMSNTLSNALRATSAKQDRQHPQNVTSASTTQTESKMSAKTAQSATTVLIEACSSPLSALLASTVEVGHYSLWTVPGERSLICKEQRSLESASSELTASTTLLRELSRLMLELLAQRSSSAIHRSAHQSPMWQTRPLVVQERSARLEAPWPRTVLLEPTVQRLPTPVPATTACRAL